MKASSFVKKRRRLSHTTKQGRTAVCSAVRPAPPDKCFLRVQPFSKFCGCFPAKIQNRPGCQNTGSIVIFIGFCSRMGRSHAIGRQKQGGSLVSPVLFRTHRFPYRPAFRFLTPLPLPSHPRSAPGGIDENRPIFHFRQGFPIDGVPRFRRALEDAGKEYRSPPKPGPWRRAERPAPLPRLH